MNSTLPPAIPMFRSVRLIACFLIALLFSQSIARAAAGDAPASPHPAILFAYGYYDAIRNLDKTAFKRLREAGWEVGTCSQEELQPSLVSKYNVILLLGFPKTEGFVLNASRVQSFNKTLTDFMAKGGGIFVNNCGGESPFGIQTSLEFLKPLGCTPMLQEIKDPETRTIGTLREFPFARTTEITPDPLTRNVRALWYPIEFGKNIGESWTQPFQVDSTWKVLARAGKSARTSYEPMNNGAIDAITEKTPLASDIPLFAIKDRPGQRLAVSGIHPSFTWAYGFTEALDGVFLEKGLNGQPSDGWTLYSNALRWLAEPSLGKGKLGGYTTTPEVVASIKKLLPEVPDFDWKNMTPQGPRPMAKGMFGAQSNLSGGQNSVEEMATAAKEAGLDYIVFAEDFANLKSRDAAAFTKACQAVSDDKFTAFPGFFIRDEVGGYWFYARSPVEYPPAGLLAPDGQRFISFMAPGSMWCMQCEFWLHRQPMVSASLKHNEAPYPFWDYRDYGSVALYTYENGKLVDDLTHGYPGLQQNDQHLAPISMSLVKSVSELKQAAASQPLTYLAGANGGDLVKRLNTLGDYWEEAHSFVTSGPVIGLWRVTKGSNGYASSGDFFRSSLYRWHVGLQASSPAGIREVRILDGERLFRRFIFKGVKEINLDIPLVHDRQHHLTAWVEDMQGKLAISHELYDRNQLMQDFYCSDHNNSLLCGILRNPDGSSAEFDCNVLSLKGPWFFDYTAMPTTIPGQNPAAGFDGGVFGSASLHSVMNMQTQPAWDQSLDARDQLYLASADICVRERLVDHKFREGNRGVFMAWQTILPVMPTECFDMEHQITLFQPAVGARAVFALTQFTFTIKKDLELAPGAPARLDVGYLDPRASKGLHIQSSDAGAIDFRFDADPPAEKLKDYRGSMRPGDFLCAYDGPLGMIAYYPVSSTVNFETFGAPKPVQTVLSVPVAKRSFKKGDTIQFALLMATSRMHEPEQVKLAEEIALKYGLGEKASTSLSLQTGSTGQTRVWASLGAVDGGVSGVLKYNSLPANLPVRVSGQNDRWTAVLSDIRGRRSRPVAVMDGETWTSLPGDGAQEFFIGHPFTCDQPEAALTAIEGTDGKWLIDVHNPTDRPMKVTVRKSPEFPMTGAEPFTVELAPGSSVIKEVTIVFTKLQRP